jgi:hypothetical protein
MGHPVYEALKVGLTKFYNRCQFSSYFYPPEQSIQCNALPRGYTSCAALLLLLLLHVCSSFTQLSSLRTCHCSRTAMHVCSLIGFFYCSTAAARAPVHACSLISCHCKRLQSACMQFKKLQGIGARAHPCSLRTCYCSRGAPKPCSGSNMHAARRQSGSLVIWTTAVRQKFPAEGNAVQCSAVQCNAVQCAFQ